MNRCTMLAAAVATVLLTAGCEKPAEKPKEEVAPAAPVVDLAAEESAIRNKSAEWMNFANAHDAASIAKNFAPEAITIYDGRVRRGAAEIQAGIEQDDGIRQSPR